MKPSRLATLLPRGALTAAAGLLAGCSLQPIPSQEMSQARTAIDSAATAHDIPELERARTKVALAQRWVDAKDHGPARWLAEQAEVDAELAAARAASNAARRTLAQLEQSPAAVVRTSYSRVSNGTEKVK